MTQGRMTLPVHISCKYLVLLVLFLGASKGALAQDDPVKSAIRPGTLWLVDLGVGEGYDDNPLGAGGGGYFTQFNPLLGVREDNQHGFWSFSFQPSVQRFYDSSIGDRVTENISTLDSWRMSRRWTFDVNGNYLHSNDPFARSQEIAQPEPVGGSGVVSPNSAFVGVEAPFTVLTGSGTFHYQIRRHSELSFGGDYLANRETAQGLPNTRSWAVRAAYKEKVRRTQTFGVDYSAQFFAVTNPVESVVTNTLVLRYDFESKSGKDLDLFAGPQYSSVSAKLTSGGSSVLPDTLNRDILNYSAGAIFSWRITEQNDFQLTATRRVVDGAGVSGAAVQDEAQLRISRKLNKRLMVSIGSFYSEYQALLNLPIAPNSWGAFNRIDIALGPRSSLAAEYDHSHQAQLLSLPLEALFSHNRALIEYRYSLGTFSKEDLNSRGQQP